MDSAELRYVELATYLFACLVKSKPVKQEISCTVILPTMASVLCMNCLYCFAIGTIGMLNYYCIAVAELAENFKTRDKASHFLPSN